MRASEQVALDLSKRKPVGVPAFFSAHFETTFGIHSGDDLMYVSYPPWLNSWGQADQSTVHVLTAPGPLNNELLCLQCSPVPSVPSFHCRLPPSPFTPTANHAEKTRFTLRPLYAWDGPTHGKKTVSSLALHLHCVPNES